MQPHLIKCFDAIKRLQFGDNEDAKKMLAIVSSEAEVVPFINVPMAEGNVESWLLGMQFAMYESLHIYCKRAFLQLRDEITMCTNGPFSAERAGSEGGLLDQWFFGYPAQGIIMQGQIEWTFGVEDALIKMVEAGEANALVDYSAQWVLSINYMVGIVRRQLTPLQRQVIGAKLTLDVHCRDTNAEMVHKKVGSIKEFEWAKQLRYYWEEDVDDCCLRQTNTYFRYGYEYLGNSPRLVVTPLTDKCYMTLTGGLNLGMGGAPAGPAGTGKTETTKDLAKALARQCVVMVRRRGSIPRLWRHAPPASGGMPRRPLAACPAGLWRHAPPRVRLPSDRSPPSVHPAVCWPADDRHARARRTVAPT